MKILTPAEFATQCADVAAIVSAVQKVTEVAPEQLIKKRETLWSNRGENFRARCLLAGLLHDVLQLPQIRISQAMGCDHAATIYQLKSHRFFIEDSRSYGLDFQQAKHEFVTSPQP